MINMLIQLLLLKECLNIPKYVPKTSSFKWIDHPYFFCLQTNANPVLINAKTNYSQPLSQNFPSSYASSNLRVFISNNKVNFPKNNILNYLTKISSLTTTSLQITINWNDTIVSVLSVSALIFNSDVLVASGISQSAIPIIQSQAVS